MLKSSLRKPRVTPAGAAPTGSDPASLVPEAPASAAPPVAGRKSGGSVSDGHAKVADEEDEAKETIWCTMQICTIPTRVRQGRFLRRFQCAHEFHVSMSVTVEQAPIAKSSIMHCAINGRCENSSWPRISVVPGNMVVHVISASGVDVPLHWSSWVTVEIKRHAVHKPKAVDIDAQEEEDDVFDVSRIETVGLPGFNPAWDHKEEMPCLRPYEQLRFTLSKVPSNMVGSTKSELMHTADGPSLRASQVGLKQPVGVVASETIAVATLRYGDIFPGGFAGDLRFQPQARGIEDAIENDVVRGLRLRVDVAPKNECRFVADVHAGSTKYRLEGPALPVHSEVQVAFEVKECGAPGQYDLSFAAGGLPEVATIEGVHLILPQLLAVYLGSPVEPPAAAIVSAAKYRWVTEGVDHDPPRVTFDLPPNERVLLARFKERVEHSKEWRAFDALFGFVLVANAVQIGLQLEMEHAGSDLISKDAWRYIDLGFICIFFFEIVCRFYLMLWRNRTCYFDPWIAFDIFIVILSIFFWFDPDGDMMPFPVSLLRVFRLLKLAKLVRLVRAFHELGILIESLMASLYLLLWASVLLLFVIFMAATVLVTLTTFIVEDRPETEEAVRDWRRLFETMWNLLKMTCYDQWAEELRIFFYLVGGWRGLLTGFFLLVLTTITTIGIGYIVVGLMCHSAFQLAQNDLRMKSAENLEAKREALAHFRHHLKTYGKRPLFTSDRFITKEELLAAMDPRDPHTSAPGREEGPNGKRLMAMADVLKVLEMSMADFIGLADVFVENGELEIEGLVEAVGIIQLQRYLGALRATDDLIAGKTAFAVRPGDMLFFSFSLGEVEQSVRAAETHVMSITSLVVDMMTCIDSKLKDANFLATLEASSINISAKQQHIEGKWMSNRQDRLTLKPLADIVEAEKDAHVVNNLSIGIDIIGGTIILLNGVFTGVQTTYEDPTSKGLDGYQIIDLGFGVLFSIELGLRWLLYADILEATELVEEEVSSHTTRRNLNRSAKEGIRKLESSLIWGIFPPYPKRGRDFLWSCLPGFLSNVYTAFDVFVVVICLADVSFFFLLRTVGWADIDAGVFSVIRCFRLIRLVKLLRVLRVFPQLQQLVYVVMSVGRLVTWTLCIIVVVLHVFAILMVIIYGKKPDARFENYFGGFFNCMITGWQFLTLDSWNIPMDLYEDEHGTVGALLVLMIFCIMVVVGLILMNMAVGVMSTSALGITQWVAKEKSYEAFLRFVSTMAELVDLFEQHLGSHTMTQDMVERAMDIKLRTSRPTYDSRRTKVARDLSQEVRHKVNDEFLERFQRLMAKARLLPQAVKDIFEKLDYERQGHLDIYSFIDGALVLKAEFAKLDLYSLATAVKMVRVRCNDVAKRLTLVRHKIDTFMQLLSSLFRMSEFQERVLSRQVLETPASLMRLSFEGERALANVVKWAQEGSVHPLGGRLLVKPGLGRLRVADEHKLEGRYETDEKTVHLEGEDSSARSALDMRRIVEPGDLVVLDRPRQRGEGGAFIGLHAVGCFAVQHVLNRSMIRCHVEQQRDTSFQAWCQYHIVSIDRDAVAAEKEAKAASTGTATHDVLQAPIPHLNPQDAQRLFEWEIHTTENRRKVVEEVDWAMRLATEGAARPEDADGRTGANDGDARRRRLALHHHASSRVRKALREELLQTKEFEKEFLSQEYNRLVLELVRLADRRTLWKFFVQWRPERAVRNFSREVVPGPPPVPPRPVAPPPVRPTAQPEQPAAPAAPPGDPLLPVPARLLPTPPSSLPPSARLAELITPRLTTPRPSPRPAPPGSGPVSPTPSLPHEESAALPTTMQVFPYPGNPQRRVILL